MDCTYVSITDDLNFLAHYGVPGQEWYVNKAERYQNHAQYARFHPKFIVDRVKKKVEDAANKLSEKRNANNKAKATDGNTKAGEKFSKNATTMTDDELRKATQRLNLEKDYLNALQNNIDANRKYKALMAAPAEAKRKQFWNDVKTVGSLLGPKGLGLTTYVGNYAKLSLYEALAKEYGTEKADAIINGKIGSKDGGKKGKNKGGGDNSNNQSNKNSREDIMVKLADARKTASEAELNEANAESIRIQNERLRYFDEYVNAVFPQPAPGTRMGSGGKKREKEQK